jgi:histidinol dehydrogenase
MRRQRLELTTMRIIKNIREREEFLRRLQKRSSDPDESIERKVKAILEDVRKTGDAAVLRYTREFDSVHTARLSLPQDEISRHASKVSPSLLKALKISAKRIRAFHERQREKSWMVSEKGSLMGLIVKPIERIGAYVPGGKAAYPSTVLMNVIPAQVAGVKEIVVCVPTPHGEISPPVMAAIEMLGVKEVYRIGGAQAIAAMAFGTKKIRRVDKIVGPGNIYVATAKKMVFGQVDIDMIAGPSEILILADDTAQPSFIAADMLAQAEHDEHASAVLVTDSRRMAAAVATELGSRLEAMSRKEIAGKSLDSYGAIIVTESMEDAVSVANAIAPEHLEIVTRRPKKILSMVRNAGAIFLAEWTPEALGDYAAGPNHTLPTGGTARFSSPLGVYDFVKRSSLISFTEEGFRKLAPTVKTIADAEGLEGHGNTIRVRERE